MKFKLNVLSFPRRRRLRKVPPVSLIRGGFHQRLFISDCHLRRRRSPWILWGRGASFRRLSKTPHAFIFFDLASLRSWTDKPPPVSRFRTSPDALTFRVSFLKHEAFSRRRTSKTRHAVVFFFFFPHSWTTWTSRRLRYAGSWTGGCSWPTRSPG